MSGASAHALSEQSHPLHKTPRAPPPRPHTHAPLTHMRICRTGPYFPKISYISSELMLKGRLRTKRFLHGCVVEFGAVRGWRPASPCPAPAGACAYACAYLLTSGGRRWFLARCAAAAMAAGPQRHAGHGPREAGGRPPTADDDALDLLGKRARRTLTSSSSSCGKLRVMLRRA